MRRAAIAIDQALTDPLLLGAALGDARTWRKWISILRAAFALPMDAQDRETFALLAGGREPPTRRVSELWVCAGRRSGKSRIAAAIASFVAAVQQHSLARGETGHALVLAASKSQAGVSYEYLRAFLESSPVLHQQILGSNSTELRLKDDIVVGTHANSFRTVRGRSLLAAIFDEVAYWRDESSSVPDVETYRAVLPALATTGGILIGISSPYRRAGLLHEKFRDHFGQSGDDVLVVQAPSLMLNETLDASVIERARASDPEAAKAEWDAEFRSDLSALLDDGSIEGAIDYTRPLELAPTKAHRYVAFLDSSGGRHDAFTVCVGHKEGKGETSIFIADVVRGRKPPFNAQEVTREYVALAKAYGVSKIIGDAYSGEWLAQAVHTAGGKYELAKLNKSQLYLEAVPLFARGALRIPNVPTMIRELRLLERRVHRSGRDSVDHPQNGSDDFSNSLVGALHLAMSEQVGGYVRDLSWVNGPDTPKTTKPNAWRAPGILIR